MTTMAPEPKYSSRGGVNSNVWWGVGVAILLMLFGAGAYWYFFLQPHEPGQPPPPPPGASAVLTDDHCIGKVEKKLQDNLGEPDRKSGKTKFELDHNTEERLKKELTDHETEDCLKPKRARLWAILSDETGSTFAERLALANDQVLIKWNSEKQWTIPKPADPALAPAGQASMPPPKPLANTPSTPSTPDDQCVKIVENVLSAGLSVEQRNPLRVKINDKQHEDQIKEILHEQGDCLKKLRPDFSNVLALGLETDDVKTRLNRTVEANLLVIGSTGPIILVRTATEPQPHRTDEATVTSEKSAAAVSAAVDKLASRLDAIADKLNTAGASASTSSLVLIVLVTLLFVVEAARLWLEWINGGNPLTRTSRLVSHLPDVSSILVNWDDDQSAGRKLAMNYSRDVASITQFDLNRAVLDALRKLQDGQTRQEKALEELVRLQRLIAQGGRAGTNPSNVNDVTGGSGLAIPGRIETSSGQSRQSSALVLGHDAFEDYQRLEKALFLPEEQRRSFQERWKAQLVAQVSEQNQFVLRPANTDGKAVMWVLTGAEDRGGHPVVLAPSAYESRMTESRGQPLHIATHAFFNMASKTGARVTVDRPAWVRREGQQEVFICIEEGVLRA